MTQPRQQRPEVVYVLPNKLGGVFSYVHHLLSNRRPDGFTYAAVRTQNARDRDHNIFEPLAADRDVRFEYSLPPENVHAVLRRLALTVPFGPGVIVRDAHAPPGGGFSPISSTTIGSPLEMLLLLGMAVVCLLLSEAVWRVSVRHYTSASS